MFEFVAPSRRAALGALAAASVMAMLGCKTGGSSPSPTPVPPPTGASLVSCASMSSGILPPDHHTDADIASLNALAPASTGARATRSGAWSDASTWGGRVPASGAVVIPAGIGVIIDQQLAPAFTSVRVDGCLEFARTLDTRLRTDLLYVAPGGEIWVGSEAAPIGANVSAEITLPSIGFIDVTRDPRLIGKGFAFASKTTIAGAPKTQRVRTAVAPLEGDTVLALAATPQGWRVGDKLVLTSTRYVKFIADANGIRRSTNSEDEELTITAINGASVTVSPALRFDHTGPRATLQPYVVNFTRNVRFLTEGGVSIPVHQRAHSIFMSPQTIIHSAEFRDMGRTNKSVRAVSVDQISNVQPGSNIKGRYPVHLHKAIDPSGNAGADVRNIAVWGSPGWGVTQHSGAALLYDNAVYNAFGAGFVSESGDEMGAWVGNTAIRSEGVAEIVKDAASVAAFDLARTGDGYWFQGRLLHIHDNVAAGMGGGVGFVFMHRGTDLGTNPIAPDMALQPASLRYASDAIDAPNLQQFTNNETYASRVGYHVVKTSPRQPHDSRSVIDQFTAWEVETGIELTYVSGYTIKNALVVGTRFRPTSNGIDLGENTYDVGVVDSEIDGFDTGVFFSHFWTNNFGPAAYYFSANNTFLNIGTIDHRNVQAEDIVLAATPSSSAPSVAFSWGAAYPVWGGSGNRVITVSGTKSDAAGSQPYPNTSVDFKFPDTGVQSLLRQFGYYRLSDGRRVAVAPEHVSDRFTGEIGVTDFVFEIDPTFSLAAFTDNGLLDLAGAPPAAQNDMATTPRDSVVLIDALANDGAGALAVIGMTPARLGAARILADGRIQYAAYPGVQGADSFRYFVRGANGKIASARIDIAVQ